MNLCCLINTSAIGFDDLIFPPKSERGAYRELRPAAVMIEGGRGRGVLGDNHKATIEKVAVVVVIGRSEEERHGFVGAAIEAAGVGFVGAGGRRRKRKDEIQDSISERPRAVAEQTPQKLRNSFFLLRRH